MSDFFDDDELINGEKNDEIKNNSENSDEDFFEENSNEKQSGKRKRKSAKQQDADLAEDQNIVHKSLELVLHESMMPYSEYVIMDRALPRVEDGLKPVQRRVLYSMLEVGVLPDRPFRKSARIVGDCMGKYHPHGDKSIYDTMVRLAQDFNMSEILVKGHGNFGSVDGDSAAAMRYTEAKLSPLSMELLRDIEKDTVTWSYNFDDSCKEPDVLPGRFPNLLVNGGSGIAVGLATNIPTHNMRETINAVCAYIDNRNITLSEIMKFLPGPDFPTGAYILKESELKNVYKTGRGKIIIRAKLHIENADNGKKNIVVTEIPYQVNKANLLQKIANVKEADQTGHLAFISEIVDESDRSGTRAVIKLKKDAKIGNILSILYKYTDLQTSFNANMVAIADGRPKLLSLLEIIQYYVEYQQKVVYNRTKYDLEVCIKKEHILEGLVIAINIIDEVVKIIRSSKSVTDAKINLIQRFDLSEVQAQAILDMRLARLTSLEVNKLVTELQRLKDLIKRFSAILKSPALQMKIVKQEMMEIGKNFGVERRTKFLSANEDLPEEDAKAGAITNVVEKVAVIVTPARTIKAVTQKSYNLATKELSLNASLHEIPQLILTTTQDKDVYLFSNIGNSIKINVAKINLCKYKDRGANISAHYKNLEDNENIVSMLELSDENADEELVFVTKLGMIKITKVSEYFATKQSIASIKLKDGDEVVYVGKNIAESKIGLFTRVGIGMIVPKDDIAVCGRVSVGIKGINLVGADEVVSAMQVMKNDAFAVVGNNGMFKLLKQNCIPAHDRNKKGSRILPAKLNCKTAKIAIFNKNLSFVLETINSELVYLSCREMLFDSVESIGKYLKGTRGNGMIENVYDYRTI